MTLFGYTNNGHGNMSINEEEAEIIRYIFDLYLAGYGYIKISQAVKELNSPVARRLKFSRSTIAEIVHNEKYAGDRLLQKIYSSDHITKKQLRNKGELPKFFAEGTHDAIIGKETYEKVQQENARQIKKYYYPKAV